ncbi:hypothetical protein [Nocardia wallacei]|uniref:hypothetical protein n=2 Tax=Nocardia wallacei TaxID=480035 RepID=UPI0024544EC1|nr:hypothetical protein [Nocardia wallacei]
MPESPARPAMQELMAKLETLTGVPIDPDGRFTEWLTGNVDGFVMALEMLLADGWRPPPPAVEGMAELDALPVGAVVRTEQGRVAVKAEQFDEPTIQGAFSWWDETGVDEIGVGSDELDDLPATVLWLPDPKGDGDA